MTAEQAETAFSAAYDEQLDADTQREFDAALQADPQLAQRYAAFCRTLGALKNLEREALAEQERTDTPDLLYGVQRRLREKSAGRFYADRFAERSGWGARRLIMPLAVIALGLAALWAVSLLLRGVQLAQ